LFVVGVVSAMRVLGGGLQGAAQSTAAALGSSLS
jgi:hypothetical protein